MELSQHWIICVCVCVCVWVCVCKVAQSCPTLCNSMDCNPPDPSVHGISQATILEWVAISFARRSSQHRDQTRVSCVSCLAGSYLSLWSPGKLCSNTKLKVNKELTGSSQGVGGTWELHSRMIWLGCWRGKHGIGICRSFFLAGQIPYRENLFRSNWKYSGSQVGKRRLEYSVCSLQSSLPQY